VEVTEATSMSTMSNKLGEFIKQRRQTLGLSQRALAKKAKVSHTAINRLEAAEVTPETETIEAIATALGVRVSDLLSLLQGKSIQEDKDPLLSMLFSEIERLSPPKKKMVLDLISVLLKHEDALS